MKTLGFYRGKTFCTAQKAGNKRSPISQFRLDFSCQMNPLAAVHHEGSKQNPVLLRARNLRLHSGYEMLLGKENLNKVILVGMFR